QGVEVEAEVGGVEGLPVLGVDETDLGCEGVHRLVELVERRMRLLESVLEVGERLVPGRAQSRGHDEHRVALLLVDGHLARRRGLSPGRDAGIRDGEQTLADLHPKAERHYDWLWAAAACTCHCRRPGSMSGRRAKNVAKIAS